MTEGLFTLMNPSDPVDSRGLEAGQNRMTPKNDCCMGVEQQS